MLVFQMLLEAGMASDQSRRATDNHLRPAIVFIKANLGNFKAVENDQRLGQVEHVLTTQPFPGQVECCKERLTYLLSRRLGQVDDLHPGDDPKRRIGSRTGRRRQAWRRSEEHTS